GGADGGEEEDGGTTTAEPATKKGGCGCITAGSPEGSAPLLLAMSAILGAFAVRRRRSSAS
ncbi:MAG: MYXO-CTERM sorting domain-containing protein, partial [Polyangiaceae bacterium]